MARPLLWLLVALLVLLDFTAGVKLKRCSARKPGKHTSGCGFTCNRRTGEWRAKLCRVYAAGVPDGQGVGGSTLESIFLNFSL